MKKVISKLDKKEYYLAVCNDETGLPCQFIASRCLIQASSVGNNS